MAELQPFYNLKDRDLKNSGACIVEGHTLVRRLAAIGIAPLSLLCVEGQGDIYESLFEGSCPVYLRNHDEIQRIIGFKFHRGVLAAVPRPSVPRLAEQDSLLGEPGLLVSCMHIQEGSNLGAVIRSAKALGARGVILGPDSADPFSRKAVRASAAWVFSLPLFWSESAEAAADLLASRQWSLLAAESSQAGAISLEEFCRERAGSALVSQTLFLGHEFTGLGEAMLSRMDYLLEIPMEAGVDSLNVATAAGIFIYRLVNS